MRHCDANSSFPLVDFTSISLEIRIWYSNLFTSARTKGRYIERHSIDAKIADFCYTRILSFPSLVDFTSIPLENPLEGISSPPLGARRDPAATLIEHRFDRCLINSARDNTVRSNVGGWMQRASATSDEAGFRDVYYPMGRGRGWREVAK